MVGGELDSCDKSYSSLFSEEWFARERRGEEGRYLSALSLLYGANDRLVKRGIVQGRITAQSAHVARAKLAELRQRRRLCRCQCLDSITRRVEGTRVKHSCKQICTERIVIAIAVAFRAVERHGGRTAQRSACRGESPH